ncbi:Proteasome subunit beta type-5-like protein [Dinothrombium tinctorium]|uniref:Proteasome subunit beta n=1 Tax=Dinothrombium tinctorium TaxID=1965070 RepID=A0A443QZB7_9ACAR|nr:Proteasome subunit beta type-5-like protein [Dinothrombium tinctorium]
MALQSLLNLPQNASFDLFERNDGLNRSVVDETCDWHKTQLPIGVRNMASKQERIFDMNTGESLKIDLNKGTTTLAFKYQGGICVCADSRATGGEFIGSTSVKKIIEINDYLLGTMAGGAADCVYWERVLAERCRIYELRNRERISVAAASKLLANMLYNYKGMGLSLGVMICGWDKKGPGLYYVDNDGNRFPGSMFSVGSGSPFAYGILDAGYDYNLTDEEAFELGRRAVFHAAYRDMASGGLIRVYSVKETGWKAISIDDSADLYYKYQDEKMV